MKIKLAFPGIFDIPRYEPMDAIVFGVWAAHCYGIAGVEWQITHVPTGKRVDLCLHLTRDEAVHIAHRLSMWGDGQPTKQLCEAAFGEVLDGVTYL
jgi:hypothetical protein